MTTELSVADFKKDWVERRICPILKQSPFTLIEANEIMTKVHRKNREGKELYGKQWISMNINTIKILCPKTDETIQDNILSLSKFSKTWVPPVKITKKTAAVSS